MPLETSCARLHRSLHDSRCPRLREHLPVASACEREKGKRPKQLGLRKKEVAAERHFVSLSLTPSPRVPSSFSEVFSFSTVRASFQSAAFALFLLSPLDDEDTLLLDSEQGVELKRERGQESRSTSLSTAIVVV